MATSGRIDTSHNMTLQSTMSHGTQCVCDAGCHVWMLVRLRGEYLSYFECFWLRVSFSLEYRLSIFNVVLHCELHLCVSMST